jgi:hypothetical protein
MRWPDNRSGRCETQLQAEVTKMYKTRWITALALIPVVVSLIYLGDLFFFAAGERLPPFSPCGNGTASFSAEKTPLERDWIAWSGFAFAPADALFRLPGGGRLRPGHSGNQPGLWRPGGGSVGFREECRGSGGTAAAGGLPASSTFPGPWRPWRMVRSHAGGRPLGAVDPGDGFRRRHRRPVYGYLFWKAQALSGGESQQDG